jgi:hypothetical protein
MYNAKDSDFVSLCRGLTMEQAHAWVDEAFQMMAEDDEFSES